MKVFVALVLAIASVSARGSGPYLPSGWRPEGPSFFLPSEVARVTASPVVQEAVFFEAEASGSDALREYGPPKVQEVPAVAIEQTFAEVKTEEVAAVEESAGEQTAAIIEEVSTATEVAVVAEEQVAELTDAQPTAAVLEQTSEVQAEEIKEEVAPTAAAVEEVAVPVAVVAEEIVVPTAVVTEEVAVSTAGQEAVAERVVVEFNNIAEALVNLEQEVKAVEVQAVENAAVITQEVSGAIAQAPEGFLEYGPPGFTEYGPPKQDSLARVAVEATAANAVQNNEVRRRRFSPKFRSAKKH